MLKIIFFNLLQFMLLTREPIQHRTLPGFCFWRQVDSKFHFAFQLRTVLIKYSLLSPLLINKVTNSKKRRLSQCISFKERFSQ